MNAWENPDARPHLTIEEVKAIVARVDAGETYNAIAVDIGRHHSAVSRAVERWKAGTGRLAARAKHEGSWP